MTGEAVQLGPVRGRARIEVLDIMRGIAILGILFMNIPFMGANASLWMGDPRRLSWTPLDQGVFAAIAIVWEGTQRGLFEFLFGAGALVLTAKAMKPTDPVAVADLFFRRNFLLIGFGLLDIFLVGWIGDILLIYGLAALLIFPFRTVRPKLLLALGLFWAVASGIGWHHGGGLVDTLERNRALVEMPQLEQKKASGAKLTKEEQDKLKDWQKKKDSLDLSKPLDPETKEMVAAETKAHSGSPIAFLTWTAGVWKMIFFDGHGTFFSVFEAACGMFIGMALFKWGVIQGERSMRFYALLAICAYTVGFGLRGWNVVQMMSFTLEPKIGWITNEFARLAVTLGHVGFFNLLVKTPLGHFALSPFKAAGRMAFSIYVGTSVAALWFVFAPWGLNLWGRFGWTQLMLTAVVIDIAMLVIANLWLRAFACGPLEWVWRSLAYWQRQPFRRVVPAAAVSDPVAALA